MLMTPALAFLPNSVPCGPRRISMRSTSTRSSVAWPGRAVTTPSSTIDTVGSTPGEVLIVPTPRMNSELSLFEALVRKFTVGVCCVITDRLLRLPSSSVPPESTDTAMGVLCSGCSRLVAVMVMVSSCVGAGCAGCACCARAGRAVSRARASGNRRDGRSWGRRGMTSPRWPRPQQAVRQFVLALTTARPDISTAPLCRVSRQTRGLGGCAGHEPRCKPGRNASRSPNANNGAQRWMSPRQRYFSST